MTCILKQQYEIWYTDSQVRRECLAFPRSFNEYKLFNHFMALSSRSSMGWKCSSYSASYSLHIDINSVRIMSNTDMMQEVKRKDDADRGSWEEKWIWLCFKNRAGLYVVGEVNNGFQVAFTTNHRRLADGSYIFCETLTLSLALQQTPGVSNIIIVRTHLNAQTFHIQRLHE